MKRCIVTTIVLCGFLVWGTIALANFSTDVRVNGITGHFQGIAGEKTSIVIADDTVYTVWLDARDFEPVAEDASFTKADIYFAKFVSTAQGGLTGGANVKVNDISGSAINNDESRPAMAVGDGGTIFITWGDSRDVENQLDGIDVYFSISKDGGATFLTDIKISTDTGHPSNPVIASSEGYVYLLHEYCCSPANGVLQLRISSDNGATFAPPITLAELGSAADPAIAADGEDVYVVYRSRLDEFSGDILFVASHDFGATFSAPQKINPNGVDSVQDTPAIAAASGKVYVAWRDASEAYTTHPSGTVVFTVSKDKGMNFSDIAPVIPDGRAGDRASISASDESVAVSYTSSMVDGYGKYLYSRISKDAGVTWSEEMVVADRVMDRPDVGPSSVSTDGKRVCVLWNDSTLGDEGDDSDLYLDCDALDNEMPQSGCLEAIPELIFVSSEFEGCMMKTIFDYLGVLYCFEYKINPETLSFDMVGPCQ